MTCPTVWLPVCHQLLHQTHDPADVPAGYDPEIIWDGLGLVSRSIVPHYRSDHPDSSMVEDMLSHLDARRLPYLPLRDGEALVVVDGEERIAGSA